MFYLADIGDLSLSYRKPWVLCSFSRQICLQTALLQTSGNLFVWTSNRRVVGSEIRDLYEAKETKNYNSS